MIGGLSLQMTLLYGRPTIKYHSIQYTVDSEIWNTTDQQASERSSRPSTAAASAAAATTRRLVGLTYDQLTLYRPAQIGIPTAQQRALTASCPLAPSRPQSHISPQAGGL